MRQLLVVVLQCTKTRDARAKSCFANLRPLPHDHTYPDIFEDGDFFYLRFQKYTRLHVAYSNCFRPMEIRQHPSKSMRNAHSKSCMTSSYSKTSVFVRQCKREASVFKNLHSGERFLENQFSVTVFTGYVRMVGETRDKKPPFRTKTDTCERGLIHTYSDIFENGHFFSAFEKYASTRGVFE